jgi:hypothetical protein
MRPTNIAARIVIAVVMAGAAFALAMLGVARAALGLVPAIAIIMFIGAGLIALWIAWPSPSLRYAWGRGCLVNGVMSAVAAIGLHVQNELWQGRSPSAEDLDRAIGPLTHLVWALAARVGAITLVLALVLLALSYWLLGPPHRRA